MPVPTIFMIASNKAIVEMTDQPYDSEDTLQRLLADFPSVLAGDQMSDTESLKWLLIEREAGIPDADGGSERWSLDHVFVDQNGIPTLVEVKRSTNAQIRREVVGQILEYAANAVLYWPVDSIRQAFEKTCAQTGAEPSNCVADFIGSEGEGAIAQFWEKVETNLRAGKIRLIFAADQIPPELRRIVEFLNEQMNPAEVIAIEIRQYVGSGFQALVPSVIGSPKRGAATSVRSSVQWDRTSFLVTLRERKGPEIAEIAERILDWASATQNVTLSWGKGKIDGSCNVGVNHNLVSYFLFSIWTYGRIQLNYQQLQYRQVPLHVIEDIASGLSSVSGIRPDAESLNRYPSFDIAALKASDNRKEFLDTVGRGFDKIIASLVNPPIPEQFDSEADSAGQGQAEILSEAMPPAGAEPSSSRRASAESAC